MSEMLERVRAAIANMPIDPDAMFGVNPADNADDEDTLVSVREFMANTWLGVDWFDAFSLRVARVVVEQIREPTPGMVEAGVAVAVADFIPAGQYEASIFTAMIGEALGEG